MSEKVTFQELIESIAKEADQSKQFTHDFLKDFADIISDGLKDGQDVNIAGFGKFKTKQVDERDGYNPHTEEKMIIPAHQKMLFKPYKGLRELVNAPYEHLEAELIDHKPDVETEANEKTADQQAPATNTGNDSSQNAAKKLEEELGLLDESTDPDEPEQTAEIIPEETEDVDEGAEIQEVDKTPDSSETEDDDPFNFADEVKDSEIKDGISEEDQPETAPELDEEEDVVEFRPDSSIEDDRSAFIGSEAVEQDPPDDLNLSPDEEAEQPEASAINFSPDSPLGMPDGAKPFDEVADEENALPQMEEREDNLPDNRISSSASSTKVSPVSVLAAAVLLVLLAAGGAWYFNVLSDRVPDEAASALVTTGDDRAANGHQKNNTGSASQKTIKQKQVTQPISKRTTNQPIELKIEEGATLWSIAEEMYGNPRLWPWIYNTNETIENPDLIYAGATLGVPQTTGIPSGLSSQDSLAVAKGYIATYRWYKQNNTVKARRHLWFAEKYYQQIRKLARVQIDKPASSSGNMAR